MPKFAANLSFLFPELNFLDRFAAARAAGSKAVEFAFVYEHSAAEIAAAAAAANAEIVLMNLPPGNWGAGERGLAALTGREGEFRASLDTVLAYAQVCGCRQLHAMAGVPGPAARKPLTSPTCAAPPPVWPWPAFAC